MKPLFAVLITYLQLTLLYLLQQSCICTGPEPSTPNITTKLESLSPPAVDAEQSSGKAVPSDTWSTLTPEEISAREKALASLPKIAGMDESARSSLDSYVKALLQLHGEGAIEKLCDVHGESQKMVFIDNAGHSSVEPSCFHSRNELGKGHFAKVDRVRFGRTIFEFVVNACTRNQLFARKTVDLTKVFESNGEFTKSSLLHGALLELTTMMVADHPNVISLSHAFYPTALPPKPPQLQLILPLAAGDTDGLLDQITTVLARKPKNTRRQTLMDEWQLRYYGLTIYAGLKYLHRVLGVVHHDLWVKNIFHMPSGKIKIADLGIAVSSVGAENKIEIKPSHKPPPHRAPEAYKENCCKGIHDVWSLAYVLYDFFTGIEPFLSFKQGPNKDQAYWNGDFQDPQWAFSIGRSQKFYNFLWAAFTPDPDEREKKFKENAEKAKNSGTKQLHPPNYTPDYIEFDPWLYEGFKILKFDAPFSMKGGKLEENWNADSKKVQEAIGEENPPAA